MSNRLFFILSFFFFAQLMEGKQVEEIVLKFAKDNFCFTINHDKEILINSITLPFAIENSIQSPSLPLIHHQIEIDDSQNLYKYVVEREDTLLFENVFLLPVQRLMPSSSKNIELQQDRSSSPNVLCNIEGVHFVGTHRSGNNKFLSFAVSPFRYDSENHKLYLSTRIQIRVHLNQEDIKDSFLRENLVNIKNARIMGQIPNNCNYLIITNDSLKAHYEKLADWKTRKGQKAYVVSVEDIYSSNTNPISNPQKIKTFISDYYSQNNSSLKYVLLGGDLNTVPTQLCPIWFYNRSTGTLVNSTVYSDVYYASLKQIDWSSLNNVNYIPGSTKYSDTLDLATDIAVSRIPFSLSYDVKNIINRLISYEEFPQNDTWGKNILMGGRIMTDNNYFYENGESVSDAQHNDSILYKQYISPFWNGNRVRLYDTKSDIPSVSGFTTNNLKGELSKGYTFANISTHGGAFHWTMDDGSFLYSDALSLTNQGYTIITTIACNTNAIDESVCLSKSFLKAGLGNVLAFWGSEREGWYVDDGVGPSGMYIGEMFKALFQDDFHRLGDAVKTAQNELIGFTSYNYSSFRWLHLSMNLMGDPEMPVYTERPIRFTNVNIHSTATGNVSVYSGVTGNNTYCKTSDHINNPDFYVVNYYGGVEIPNISGRQCNICITSPNYIPYQAIFGEHVYLQKKNFDGDCHVHSICDTTIGNSVTSLFPTGDVMVNGGSLMIQRANGVTITDGFEVKLGAEFSVE